MSDATVSEPVRRVLLRLAALHREHANCRVVIVLHEGGVRSYTEERVLAPADLPSDGSV